jgi:hypothetical protein
MNKNILILLLFTAVFFQCQKVPVENNTTKSKSVAEKYKIARIKLCTSILSDSISYLKLYKFNENNLCDQSKAVSIIHNNKISVCFDYIKTLKGKRVNEFIETIKDHSTYGAEDVACFDTDYSAVFYNNKDMIIGFTNISFSCHKLNSTPKITEMKYYSENGLSKIGFSKDGEMNLKKALEIHPAN